MRFEFSSNTINREQLQGVFVRQRDKNGLQVVSSATGRFEPFATEDYHKIILTDAHVYKKVDDGPNVMGQFKSLTLFLGTTDPRLVGYKVKAQSTLALRDANNPIDRAEFQWRLSTSVSTLLLALAAVPLSRSLPRRGRYAKTMMALLVYALYLNFLMLAKTWVEQDRISTIWWVPGLFALLVVIFYEPWLLLRRRTTDKQHVDH